MKTITMNMILATAFLAGCPGKLQAADSTRVKIYAWGGLSPNGIFSPYQYGASIGINRQVMQAGIYTYKPFTMELFTPEQPLEVAASSTVAISYGYYVPVTRKAIGFVPSLGIGYTTGQWRTGEREN